MKRKRAISLIEVIICLGLVTMLLSTLFFWYRSLSGQKDTYNKLKGPLVEDRFAHQQLQHIFSTIQAPPFFIASNGSMVFIFDRGLFPDPKLAGRVLGNLYFDATHQRLCLGVWPYPNTQEPLKEPSQAIVLLDGVEECRFEFYSPPDLARQPVDPEKVNVPVPREGWQDTWLSSYNKLPAFVKIIAKLDDAKGIKDHTIEYRFDLPAGIVYPKELL